MNSQTHTHKTSEESWVIFFLEFQLVFSIAVVNLLSNFETLNRKNKFDGEKKHPNRKIAHK